MVRNIFLFLFLTQIHQTLWSQSNDLKTLKFQNYTISYPANWELNQSGQMGTSFIIYSPLESDKDEFRDNINLLEQDLTGYHLDLKKFVELSEYQIKTMIKEGKLEESEEVQHCAGNYHKMVYTGNQGPYQLKFIQYYRVIDQRAYILTFTCEKSKFDRYEVIASNILNSFYLSR
jgi:hypothetical protein